MEHYSSPGAEPQLVLAIFDSVGRAEAALRALQEAGFTREQLSVLTRHSDVELTAEQAVALERDAEATSTAVAVGSTLGGLAGLLGGLALFAIPGIGALAGAGVLATTFGGAALGAAAGERAAHFRSLGVPEERSARYGQALERGEVLVAVTVADHSQARRARERLGQHAPLELDVHPLRSVG